MFKGLFEGLTRCWVVSVHDAVAYDGSTLRWSRAGDTGQWRHCSVVPWQLQWQQHDIVTPDPSMKADCCTSSQWHQHQSRGGGVNRWTQSLVPISWKPSQLPFLLAAVGCLPGCFGILVQVNNIHIVCRYVSDLDFKIDIREGIWS